MLRPILSITLLIFMALPGRAAPSAQVQALGDALQLPALMAIMAEEGLAYAGDLEAEMFSGRGGGAWQALVKNIYEAKRLEIVMLGVLDEELTTAELETLIAFYTGDLGQRVTDLEVTARRALLDPMVEEGSLAIYEDMALESHPRLALIEDFVQVNDLIERNVAGGLNSNLSFYRGLNEGGAFEYGMSESDMLADVWAQEGDVRDETAQWLYPYLTMAYEPLNDSDLQAYIDMSASEAGIRLNAALFAAFDVMFRQVSYDLGFGAAQFIKGQEL